jgi:uncharacterized protein YecE (DUF72 family)
LELKVGCCGFSAAHSKYATLFPVVEVQQTFYQPPMLKTLQRWRAEMPPEFEFTLKAWQLITHEAYSQTYKRLKLPLSDEQRRQAGSFKDSPLVWQGWDTTLECAEALAARRVLFQCPAGFKPTDTNLARLRHFFNKAERANLQFLWEPRGGWPDELVLQLCRELELIHVVDPFIRPTVTPEFIYYRLHGGEGFRHVYNDAELQTLLEGLPSNSPAYIMFNNIEMLSDAGRFSRLVASLGNQNSGSGML